MTTFDRREEAFENRFAHDEELDFKAIARRNHKLGLWAARLLRKEGNDAEAYAMAVIALAVEGADDAAIVQRLHADLSAAGVVKSDHQIRRQMDEYLLDARREIREA